MDSSRRMSIEAGVGDAVFSGSVSNKLEVETGTGDVNVSLTGTEKSYAFDLSAGPWRNQVERAIERGF